MSRIWRLFVSGISPAVSPEPCPHFGCPFSSVLVRQSDMIRYHFAREETHGNRANCRV